MIEKTCCFIGHRKIRETPELQARLTGILEKLIVDEGFNTFLFGSKSDFNSLCYNTVTQLKEKYPHIKRIYVRAEFPYIDESYKNFLLEQYEDTYYCESMLSAGKAVYAERNYHMIRQSQVCVVYYNPEYKPSRRKQSRNSLSEYQPNTGTRLSCDYAIKKGKRMINTF